MKLTGMNQLWVADITYIRLQKEFVYLAVILDAFSRKVVGWALDRTLASRLPITALDQAIVSVANRFVNAAAGSSPARCAAGVAGQRGRPRGAKRTLRDRVPGSSRSRRMHVISGRHPFTLRPARSPSRLATLCTRGFSSFVTSTTALIATGANQFQGGFTLPLWTTTFSRRTQ